VALFTYTQHLTTRPLDARIVSLTTGVTFIYFHMKIGAVSRLGTGHRGAPARAGRRPDAGGGIADVPHARAPDERAPRAPRARARVGLGCERRGPLGGGPRGGATAGALLARRLNAQCRVLWQGGGRGTWRSAASRIRYPVSPSSCNVLGPRLLAHFRNRPVPPPRAGSPNRVQSIQPNATRAGRGGISSRVSCGGVRSNLRRVPLHGPRPGRPSREWLVPARVRGNGPTRTNT